MAIYLIDDAIIVRARNGRDACELTERPGANVLRIAEAGPPEIIRNFGPEDQEIEVTVLSDGPGVRVYRNLRTGEVREETD